VAKKAAAKAPAKGGMSAKGAKPAASAKSSSGNKRMTKSAIFAELAQKTGKTKKEVTEFFDALFDLIKREVSANGPREFVLPPGFIKIKRVKKKARPSTTRPDPRNPGQMITIAAKPEHDVVKPYAMKPLKDLAPKP
jgi:nucleoid DNA-binding protein